MRWKGRRESEHVEDRRGQAVAGRGGGALGSLLFALLFRGSMKTKLLVVLAIVVAAFVFKINPLQLLGLSSGNVNTLQSGAGVDPETRSYLATMLADNETVWQEVLAREGIAYRPAKLVIYTGRTQTPAGMADARMGPFYLPANETVYLDPTFFTDLKERFGATGDFAEAYVVAHEVGHHVQKILGFTDRVHSQQGRLSEDDYNRLSVRLELQADFLAGVFAHHAQEKFRFLEHGDIEEAMRCAQAIGDDRIQQMSRSPIRPDLFTHGTSEQRARWFTKGFTSGRLGDGDTFSIPYGRL